jgi:hypothetical protein
MNRAAPLLVLLLALVVWPGCADAQQRPNPRQRRDLPQRVAAQEPRCRVIDETVVDDTLRVRSLACTRIDTVMDTIRTTATPLSAAPPVAGADGTNPSASEECTVVVTEGQAPQPAVEAAEPGDVICLRGTFGLDLGFRGGGIGRNGQLLVHAKRPGTSERPITLRNEPGHEARIIGDFDAPTNLYVYITASHWRVVGLAIETGAIVVGVVDDVQILENTIRRGVYPEGNAGAVRTLGDARAGSTNILIEGNLIEDLYGCDAGPVAPCPPGSAKPWNQVKGLVNYAAIFKQGCGGTHTIRGNTIRRVPGLYTLKRSCPNDVVIVENNQFSSATWPGRCDRAHKTPVVRGNTYTGVGRAGAGGCPRG